MKVKTKYRGREAVVIAIFIFLFFPALAGASNFFFDSTSDKIYTGDTFIVQLKLSTADNSINAVEGNLSFDNEKLEVQEISAGGSIFSLWPKPAAASNASGKISFVGGVMGGWRGANAEILKIIFLAKEAGPADINFENDSFLFLNDGNGTKTSYTIEPFELLILERPAGQAPKDEWQPLLKQDANPPESFDLIIDKSNSVFEGDYFVSFFTTDKESGVDHYEIKEGADGLFINGDSPYRLRDQSLRGIIQVKAVDKAGNERVTALQPLHPKKIYQKSWFWGLIIIMLAALYLGRNVWRKKISS